MLAMVAVETLGAIVDWLSAMPVAAPLSIRSPLRVSSQVDPVMGDLRETPLFLGLDENIFGVLTEPIPSVEAGHGAKTVILMISIGANHHIGPNGLYVTLARALASSGCRSFRFDLPGVGDSLTIGGRPKENMYSKASVQDVIVAMDGLAAKGFEKFVLMGLCSSAYLAFQAALADRRVIGEVLMNPRLLMWQDGDPMQLAMRKSYKSMDFYRRSLFDPQVYQRVLRGEVDVRGIARRMFILVQARWIRLVRNLRRRGPNNDDVLALLRSLCGRGVDTLMIISEEDDGLDYVQFHLGSQCSQMRGKDDFRLVFVQEADHTFSGLDHQQVVTEIILRHLQKVIRYK